MNFSRVLVLMCCVALFEPPAQAQYSSETFQFPVSSRVVTTSGTGTVHVPPDKALITLGIRVWDKDLHLAYDQSHARTKKVLSLASTYQILPQNVQTSQIRVEPTYPSSDKSRESNIATGFEVYNKVCFLVKDMERIPDLLRDALDAGATSVSGVEFDVADLRKLKDQARALALVAAKEKAAAMAQELNAKLGKVLVMKEQGSTISELGASRWRVSNSNTESSPTNKHAFGVEDGDMLAPGQLMIDSSVSTTFELTD